MPSESQAARESSVIPVTDELLRAWPLPMPGHDADKEERGRVLIVGGSREIPGAAILAACAALRAGAGKLSIATVSSMAQAIAMAVPEARVIALPETPDGGIAAEAVAAIAELAARADALLVGPGMQDEASVCGFVQALLSQVGDTQVILDACAMGLVCEPSDEGAAGRDSARLPEQAIRFLGRYSARVLMTPHAGEMAHLSGFAKEEIEADPLAAAIRAARDWQAVVAVKGAQTMIADPTGQVWEHEGGNIGLATSGSGDTLAGIIAGLAARGAPLEQACIWGVALHARAGERLALRFGPLGYLAREIPDQIPALLHALRPG